MLLEENSRIKLQGVVYHPWCVSFEKVFKDERMKVVEIINKKKLENEKPLNKKDDFKNNTSVNTSNNNVSIISDNGKNKSFITCLSNENSRLNEDVKKYSLINEKLNYKGNQNSYKFFSKADFDSLIEDKEVEKNNFDTFNSTYNENNLKKLNNFDTFDNKFFVNPNINDNTNYNINENRLTGNLEKSFNKTIEHIKNNNKSTLSSNSSLIDCKKPIKTEENFSGKETLTLDESLTQNSLFNLNTPNIHEDALAGRDRSKSRNDLPLLLNNRTTNTLFDKVLDQIKTKGKPKNKKQGQIQVSSSISKTTLHLDKKSIELKEKSMIDELNKKLDEIKKEKDKNSLQVKDKIILKTHSNNNKFVANSTNSNRNGILSIRDRKVEDYQEVRYRDEIVTAYFDVDEKDNSIISSFNMLKKDAKDHLSSGESRLNKEYHSLSSKKTGNSKTNDNKFSKDIKNTE
jgi:hypothetical protein